MAAPACNSSIQEAEAGRWEKVLICLAHWVSRDELGTRDKNITMSSGEVRCGNRR